MSKLHYEKCLTKSARKAILLAGGDCMAHSLEVTVLHLEHVVTSHTNYSTCFASPNATRITKGPIIHTVQDATSSPPDNRNMHVDKSEIKIACGPTQVVHN